MLKVLMLAENAIAFPEENENSNLPMKDVSTQV